jgi:putative ABC transport system permease protein
VIPGKSIGLPLRAKAFLVSDSLAQLYRLGVGQTLEIPAPHGTIRLPIVGVILDYSDQQGAILIDRSVFVKYWQDDSVSDFRVFATPGAKIAEVRQAIVDHFAGRRRVFVLTNEEGRRYILKLTDDLFGMMNIQLAVAILVAVLGIFNSLTVSITDRRREFGVLQAVGANRTQIRETILDRGRGRWRAWPAPRLRVRRR